MKAHLLFINHHAMKTSWGNGRIAPRNIKLGD